MKEVFVMLKGIIATLLVLGAEQEYDNEHRFTAKPKKPNLIYRIYMWFDRGFRREVNGWLADERDSKPLGTKVNTFKHTNK